MTPEERWDKWQRDFARDSPEFRRFKATARQEHEAWKATQPKRVRDPLAPRPILTVVIGGKP